MKKLMLFAAVAVFGLFNMQSQEVKFGVKAGVNFANVNGNIGVYGINFTDAKSKVGFHVGGLAEIMLSEKFAIQPELLFSNQGFKSTQPSEIDERNKEYNISLNYINLPIMAKFFPIENLSIEAGPQVGFLISAKDEANDEYNAFNPGDPDNVKSKELYKNLDFGMNIGAGYKMDNGIYFQARYNIGLTKVDNEDYYKDEFGSDFGFLSFSRKNRVVQLSVGYMF